MENINSISIMSKSNGSNEHFSYSNGSNELISPYKKDKN